MVRRLISGAVGAPLTWLLAPLRKPGLLKYLAGPEIGGGNFLNDTAPEEKAAELQAVSSVHYTQDGKGGNGGKD